MERPDAGNWMRTRTVLLGSLAVILVLGLGALAATLRWSATRGATAAPPDRPLIVSLARPDAKEIVVLDPRTGQELHRAPHPDQGYLEIFLSPDGRRAAVMRSSPDGSTDVLEIRSLPAWSLEASLPRGASAPPLAGLASRQPDLVENLRLTFAAFSPDGTLLGLAYYGGSGDIPQLVVTLYDLDRQEWASWATSLGASSYAWLFPGRDRLLVVNRSILPQWTNSLGDVFVLDQRTGAVVAQQTIPRLVTGYLPEQGRLAPSASPSLAAPLLVGEELWLVTADLARFVLDAYTLEMRRVDPPLARDLAAQATMLAADRLVAFSPQASELLVIDPSHWRLVATHRLPVGSDASDWLLVGAEPEERTVYVGTINDGCLWRFPLDSGTLPAPLACGFYLEFPYVTYYHWPAFSPGTTAAAGATGLLQQLSESIAGIATAVLAGTFLVASLGKLFALATVADLLGTVLPRLRRWARPAVLGAIALELLTGILLLLPGTQRAGLALAGAALLVFTALAIVGARRAPGTDCSCFGNLMPARLGRATLVRNLFLLVLVAVAWPAAAAPSLADIVVASLLVLSILVVSRLSAAVTSLRRSAGGVKPRHAA